ncbi:MAG: 4-hydroxythreonine-4-phosphate dehydrogenase PdxA [Flavobacteriaceae bacterium]
MKESKKLKIAISMGDPHGIGCELILKAFEDKRMFEFLTPIVYGHPKILLEYKKKLKLQTPIFPLKNKAKPHTQQLNVVQCWDKLEPLQLGKPTKNSGQWAQKSLQAATQATAKGEAQALVTAPIDKNNIHGEDFPYMGHTDYLAAYFKSPSLMFMVHEGLRVALVTDHIPVQKISAAIQAEILDQKLNALSKSLSVDFQCNRPKIAVLGINPHSGDQGVIGQEDEEILKPWMAAAKSKKHLIFGPYAADGFFGSGAYQKFDAVLAMYHDQGLIPFKTIAFGQGVNFTAGLPIVRTSPDHGTAFDIAGKGVADVSSFRQALYTAMEIVRNRNEGQADE